ncbi:MAG: hypothetical protein V3R16_09620 [Nitrospirales bacterium]
MTASLHNLPSHERNQTWVREHFTDLLMTYGPPFLLSVLTGGVKLEPHAAKAMKEAGLPIQDNVLVATISERLRALEMIGKLGPGYRLDRTSEDDAPRRAVVFLPEDGAQWNPEWDKLAPHEMPRLASGPPAEEAGSGA